MARNRKNYSISVNTDTQRDILDFLDGLENRNEFILKLISNYLNGQVIAEKKVVDPVIESLTENVILNTSIMERMQDTMQMMCNIMSNGLVVHSQPGVVAEMVSVVEEEEEEKLDERVVSGILGDWA